jgi:hypothetical protein
VVGWHGVVRVWGMKVWGVKLWGVIVQGGRDASLEVLSHS